MKRKSTKSEDRSEVELGSITGVFGLRGEVRVFLHNPGSGFLQEARSVVLTAEDGTRTDATLSIRPGAGKRILGRIQGCNTPEAARSWMGATITVPRDVLPEVDEEEHYLIDLIGTPGRTEDGVELGRLREVHQQAEVDVWVFRQGSETWMVPALLELLIEVVPGSHVLLAAGVDKSYLL